jgi:hypothetical protein
MGVLQEVRPTETNYEYALVLGGAVDRVRLRLGYLRTLWNCGVRFKSLVMLGGQRKLTAPGETSENFLNVNNGIVPSRADWLATKPLPTTESAMMDWVYDQIDLPDEMRAVPVVRIDTALQKNQQGATVRPITNDTITSWLNMHPNPGAALAISDAPFIGYQHAVMRTLLPDTFSVETVGSASTSSLPVILDSLARRLYAEQKLHEKQKVDDEKRAIK